MAPREGGRQSSRADSTWEGLQGLRRGGPLSGALLCNSSSRGPRCGPPQILGDPLPCLDTKAASEDKHPKGSHLFCGAEDPRVSHVPRFEAGRHHCCAGIPGARLGAGPRPPHSALMSTGVSVFPPEEDQQGDLTQQWEGGV